ncbi:MAG: hypothetical protein RLY31_306 [Bacteroidota bacterium]|jgi:hypothetical protein
MKMLPILLLLSILLSGRLSAQPHRLIALTDVEADPDDAQTLIRLLLYTNEIDLEALIATTSTHQRTRVAPQTIRHIIRAYGQVRPNLLLHDPGYPTEEMLSERVTQGLPVYGMEGVGEGKDSEGSERIIQILSAADERPVYVSVWGGPNTLAQALWKIRRTRSPEEVARMLDKLRIYAISDQDDSGSWIRREFQGLFYIVSPGGYFGATWMGINQPVRGIDNTVISNRWLQENIQQGHGPLGALYPDVAYGMEGDTPSWLSLVTNGLNNPEHPDWGGWGGRYELYRPTDIPEGFTGGVPVEAETRPIWTNAEDTYTPRIPSEFGRAMRKDTLTFTGNQVSLWRWRDDFQHDFAARMDWCVQPYGKANHPPIPMLTHPDTLTVRAGEHFRLDAGGSYDPDGDSLGYWWFHYPEAGTFPGQIDFSPLSENLYNVHTIQAPVVERPESAHFILRVSDKGSPPLARYKRVIVNILP